MASSFSTSASSIDRKSLKRPDSFMAGITGLFSGLSKHTGLALGGLIVILAVSFGIATFMNRRETQTNAAKNALFLAEQALQTDMKALMPSSKGSESKALENDISFKKMDVDSKFQNAVKKFTEVEANWSGTRAAFESRQKLGNLYFNHGEISKALPWYEKALASAPNSFEKAQILSAIGYVHENLGQTDAAIQSYQKAINLGEGALKGDLLMAMARCYETLHDMTKARSTYDQILVDLPNTDYAKSAELYKSRIPNK